MNFTDEDLHEICGVLAIILHISNLSFVNAGGAQIGDSSIVDSVANLLGVEASGFAEVLTQIKRVVRGEEITTPLDVNQVHWPLMPHSLV